MALFSRITRLFRADFHAVIDQLEEPHMLLKQSVREMEDVLEQDQKHLGDLLEQHARFNERIVEFESSISSFDEKLDVCFNASNDDLARILIKRKLECQQLQKSVIAKRNSLKHELDHTQARINENTPILESMQQKLEIIAEEIADSKPNQSDSAMIPVISDADVEVTLLHEKQQRSQS